MKINIESAIRILEDCGYDCDELRATQYSVLEPTDAMALAFHSALTDGSIGQSEIDEIKTGLRAALAAAPTPPVSDEKDRIIASLQAKIDELMLEYCPEEMTDQQLENYANHQRGLVVSEVMLDSFTECGESIPSDDRKDAARYRFLRKDWFREDDAYSWLMSSECAFLESPDELDAKIDKAMKESQK